MCRETTRYEAATWQVVDTTFCTNTVSFQINGKWTEGFGECAMYLGEYEQQ